MRLSLRARRMRTLAAFGLAATLVLPLAAHATAVVADESILKVGTTQDLDSLNPYSTELLVGYEVFTLNYDLLVNFGPNNEPAPGFAESWTQSADGLTWTFKFRTGMTWSDGQPATSEDARYTLQSYLDAQEGEVSLGLGYLDPYVENAAITAVAAPNATTMTVTTSRPNDRILSMYVPVLPAHIWKDQPVATIGDFANAAPVVGSGPYQVVEWQNGQFARLVRNDNYWGDKGAAEEIVIQFFPEATNAMVEAFKNHELDYIRNPTAQQFDQLKTEPGVVTIDSPANGFTQINFNAWNGDIPNGGASTTALRDPAFRFALGYAIDRNELIKTVLGGYGTAGTTQVPAWQRDWHVEPTNVQEFSIEKAAAALDAAGYPLQNGSRMDKDGKAISLRLWYPGSDANYPKAAQFVQQWWGQLGIKVTPGVREGLGDTEYFDQSIPPDGQIDYDVVIWGWVGDPDPNSLLQILTTDAIGDSSDSQWSNARYDELYTLQNEAATKEQRKTYMTEMQQLFYDEAPYQVLYYDNELHVYWTDKFGNWQTQPTQGGTPFFVNGSINYTKLQLASAATPVPSVAPSAAPSSAVVPGASPAATTPPTSGEGSTTGDSTPLLIGGLVLLVIGVGAAVVLARQRRQATAEDE